MNITIITKITDGTTGVQLKNANAKIGLCVHFLWGAVLSLFAGKVTWKCERHEEKTGKKLLKLIF